MKLNLENLSLKQLAFIGVFAALVTILAMFVFFEGYRIYLNLVINDCRVGTVICNSPIDNLLP